VIAEAMAYGKPVVATRVGGIPELIEDGGSGFLVDRGDAAGMADRILRLLGDPAMRERMGRAGRAAVEVRFNLRENVARVLALYGLESAEKRVSTRPESVAARSPRASPS
jgi:glycosyltransferase involved in cell wall biosynthesis